MYPFWTMNLTEILYLQRVLCFQINPKVFEIVLLSRPCNLYFYCTCYFQSWAYKYLFSSFSNEAGVSDTASCKHAADAWMNFIDKNRINERYKNVFSRTWLQVVLLVNFTSWI